MNMKHVLEPVDLMVAAGIVAIVIGAFLVFVSTQGRFEITTAAATDDGANGTASDPAQPALGQTLVALFLLEQERSGAMQKAAAQLNQATMTARQIDSSAHEHIKGLTEQANNVRASNSARAEFVMGRSVVNSTIRAIRNESLEDRQREEYGHRMIHAAAEAGKKIERDFTDTEESNLGRAIVAETHSLVDAVHQNQEQVGAAIVHVTLVQDEYRRAFETAQEQVGLLVSATSRSPVSDL